MKILICMALLLALGCTDPDGCYVPPPGAPSIEILEARWTSAYCTKSYTSVFGGGLQVPGVHSYTTSLDDFDVWPGCTNSATVETTIDELGSMVGDYELAVQSEEIFPPEPTSEDPRPKPDSLLMMPRLVNVVQWVTFRPNVRTTVTVEAIASLSGLNAHLFGNFVAFEIFEMPIRFGGRGVPWSDAPISFYEQVYRDPMPTAAMRFTREVGIERQSFDLEPGVTYRALFVGEANGYRAGAANIDSDVVIDGHFEITLEPGEPGECQTQGS